MTIKRKAVIPFILAIGSLCLGPLALGQSGTSIYQGDWPVYHGGEFAQRYSPLDQINADNVDSLEIAWRFSTANFGPTTDYVNPSTPLEVDGVLYANIASTRNVVALDATSGQVLWLWRSLLAGWRYRQGDRRHSRLPAGFIGCQDRHTGPQFWRQWHRRSVCGSQER